MLFQVIEENGQKKIQPLTADAGAGNPVGTIIPMYKKSSPSGYLYCDGSTFDQNAYPLLYAYLGTNVLPDYREFALVGAEQNTTDTITSHDVYTQGEGKDDQLQGHNHQIAVSWSQPVTPQVALSVPMYSRDMVAYETPTQTISDARAGTVTRGKRKAVYFYIKATSGLSENAQDNVINTLNEQRSYSTEEHLTGKKWIDGKDIYSLTTVCTTQQTISSGVWADLQTSFSAIVQVQIESIVTAQLYISPLYITNEIDRFIVNESTINYGHLSALVNKTLLYPLETVEGISLLSIEYTKAD